MPVVMGPFWPHSPCAQLKLNADWVVLSACNTAAGDKPGAEALSGLARAFFYAGARATRILSGVLHPKITNIRSSREKALGQSLEEASADRSRWQAEFDAACLPLERLFAEQPFIAGSESRYSDYLVFSVFQWARLGSPRDVVAPGTALAEWRSRMIKLLDGLANKFPGYPKERTGGLERPQYQGGRPNSAACRWLLLSCGRR